MGTKRRVGIRIVKREEVGEAKEGEKGKEEK